MKKLPSSKAPSCAVDKFIGTDFDHVVNVSSNIEAIKELDPIKGSVGTVASNIEAVKTVATNIGDVNNVSDNMEYVKDVAAGIEGLPVVSYIGSEPPAQPVEGATWYCTTDGRTYVWYRDTDSYQWVESSPQSGVTDLSANNGASLIGTSDGSTVQVKLDELKSKRKVVILATGQSNVQQEPAYNWTPPSNVFVWAWPGLNSTGNKFIQCPNDKINHTYAAAAVLAMYNPSWEVYVIKIASGGRPIEHWMAGGSDTTQPTWNAFADCKNNVETALSVLGVDKIDYLHWHQGESNIDDSDAYMAKWDKVFERFCGEFWFEKNTKIIINGITSMEIKGDVKYLQQNLRLKKLAANGKGLRIHIPTAEIVPKDLWLSDGLHMSGEGHEFLGRAEGQTLQFGGSLPVFSGFVYEPENGAICLGGASPASGGTVEINKGSKVTGESFNSRTSLDIINNQGGDSDIASLRIVNSNGTYSVNTYPIGALQNSVRLEWTGTSQQQFAVTQNGSYNFLCGSSSGFQVAQNRIAPGQDNFSTLGNASLRLKEIFCVNGSINTSDGRSKSEPLPITDEVLDAWEDVSFISFQWLDSIHKKGEDVARIHYGVIAQQIRDAFLAKGLDGTRYGLLCYDEWNDLVEGGEVVIKAGNRWGIRPDQCLFLEAAYQRRRCDRIEARLSAAGL